ncbi:group III truncated hemoglobin [Eudoraea adriatica]|uniref:group III truncated hemoglobin n=1 Tax=Eudoraea adriatica TaxID=446681 RepID=UPI000379BFDC|nr:group III truncated hemoglobin [Eudoraea adriatica]
MKDIENRKDVENLVNEFYTKVLKDDKIGFFFNKITAIDWEKHFPIMYDFWETILFDRIKYKGNPMTKHIVLSKKEPMTSEHFERWLLLWNETVNENFMGNRAAEAIRRAQMIADLMKFKIGISGDVTPIK